MNPLLIEGQVQGGIAQSLGAALMERTVYDENGQLLARLTWLAGALGADVLALP